MATLTLAHSPDPDDAFMWWPITGKVHPHRDPDPPAVSSPLFNFQSVPADIEVLNRAALRAAASDDDPRRGHDITAISFRALPECSSLYVLSPVGCSMGMGYGPKLVVRDASRLRAPAQLATSPDTIAIPGLKTSAFMALGMLLGPDGLRRERFIEVPFDQVIPEVMEGRAEAGLVIHEAQSTYSQGGLRLLADLGAWWTADTGLPLPLGANVIRRDLDARFGPGTVREVVDLLRRSLSHALRHRQESIGIAHAFAMANRHPSGLAPTLEQVDGFVSRYVNELTVDLGMTGLEAVARFLHRGAALGLCPDPGVVDLAAPLAELPPFDSDHPARATRKEHDR